MIRRIIKIAALVILIIIVGFISFFLYSSRDQKELIQILDPKNNEKIYLIKTSWGFGDARMAIGLDKKLKGGFGYHYPEKYESRSSGDSPILYKLTNDTLYIYDGDFIKPTIDNFKTKIKLIELTPITRSDIYRDYEKLELNIFPDNQKYIIKNLAK